MEEQFRDLFKIEGNCKKVNIGDVLIAEPFMEGKYFSRSVVYIVEQNATGTIGFILNKPLPYMVGEMLTELSGVEHKVYTGGPVEENQLYYVHRHAELSNSLHIRDGIYWGGDFVGLGQLLKEEMILPHEVRFFAGYCGWDAGQLEKELEENAWMVGKVTSEEFFMMPEDQMWSLCMSELGGRYEIWAKFPENPHWN